MVKHVVTLILLVTSLAAPAIADNLTVDFEGLAPGSGHLFVSNGFRFSNPNFLFQIGSEGTNEFLAPGPEVVVMSRVDSQPFNVLRMDFSRFQTVDPPFNFVSLMAFFDGGTSQGMNIPGVSSPTFQTFNVGLSNVTFLQFLSNGTFVKIDNIVTEVPEHSTSVLLIVTFGLAALRPAVRALSRRSSI